MYCIRSGYSRNQTACASLNHSFVLNVDIDQYIDMGCQIRLHRWRIRVQGPTSTISTGSHGASGRIHRRSDS